MPPPPPPASLLLSEGRVRRLSGAAGLAPLTNSKDASMLMAMHAPAHEHTPLTTQRLPRSARTHSLSEMPAAALSAAFAHAESTQQRKSSLEPDVDRTSPLLRTDDSKLVSPTHTAAMKTGAGAQVGASSGVPAHPSPSLSTASRSLSLQGKSAELLTPESSLRRLSRGRSPSLTGSFDFSVAAAAIGVMPQPSSIAVPQSAGKQRPNRSSLPSVTGAAPPSSHRAWQGDEASSAQDSAQLVSPSSRARGAHTRRLSHTQPSSPGPEDEKLLSPAAAAQSPMQPLRALNSRAPSPQLLPALGGSRGGSAANSPQLQAHRLSPAAVAAAAAAASSKQQRRPMSLSVYDLQFQPADGCAQSRSAQASPTSGVFSAGMSSYAQPAQRSSFSSKMNQSPTGASAAAAAQCWYSNRSPPMGSGSASHAAQPHSAGSGPAASSGALSGAKVSRTLSGLRSSGSAAASLTSSPNGTPKLGSRSLARLEALPTSSAAAHTASSSLMSSAGSSPSTFTRSIGERSMPGSGTLVPVSSPPLDAQTRRLSPVVLNAPTAACIGSSANSSRSTNSPSTPASPGALLHVRGMTPLDRLRMLSPQGHGTRSPSSPLICVTPPPLMPPVSLDVLSSLPLTTYVPLRLPSPPTVAVAPTAAAVAVSVALSSAAAVPAVIAVAAAPVVVGGSRRFVPPPIALPDPNAFNIDDVCQDTPLTASPRDDDDQMSPSPACSPQPPLLEMNAPNPPAAERTEATELVDRRTSATLGARRSRSDDEEAETALAHDVQAATLSDATSAAMAAFASACAALPSASSSVTLPAAADSFGAAFVLPDARASWKNYARSALDVSVDGASPVAPVVSAAPSPRSRPASAHLTIQLRSQAADAVLRIAPAVGIDTGSAAEFDDAPQDQYADDDEEPEDDAVDFWEQMDSGAMRLF